jgi:SAM-dependent methyltransferase
MLEEEHQSGTAAHATTALLDLLMGEWTARSIHIAASLGIADVLKDGPKSIEELAQAPDTHAPSLYRLLRYLASRGIFIETGNGQIAQTELSEGLRSDLPTSAYYLARMYGGELQWKAWGDLEYSIHTGKAAVEHVSGQKLWGYLTAHPEEAQIYAHALTGASGILNQAIARSYDFSSYNTVVDVGGGQGSLLAAILRLNPTLKGVLFELPQVIESVRAQPFASELQKQLLLVGGDFFAELPDDLDIYLMKQVLHDWGDDDCLRILKTCRRAMKPESRLLVVDTVIQKGGKETSFAKLADLAVLVSHAGRERTEEEFKALFVASGFEFVRVITTGAQVSIVEAIPA